MHTRVLVYMGLYKGLEQNLPSWRLWLGMYDMHAKSWPSLQNVYILRSISPFRNPCWRISIFFLKISPPTEWSMAFSVLHKKGIRGNVCFLGMALSRKKIHSHTTVSVYWTMVGTSNLCNISPSRQMPSQVTLFSINIKIDCSIDLRTRNICKKSQVILRLSTNPSPSWPWPGWRIHEGDFARCTQGSRCIWVYTRVWNKTYCLKGYR